MSPKLPGPPSISLAAPSQSVLCPSPNFTTPRFRRGHERHRKRANILSNGSEQRSRFMVIYKSGVVSLPIWLMPGICPSSRATSSMRSLLTFPPRLDLMSVATDYSSYTSSGSYVATPSCPYIPPSGVCPAALANLSLESCLWRACNLEGTAEDPFAHLLPPPATAVTTPSLS